MNKSLHRKSRRSIKSLVLPAVLILFFSLGWKPAKKYNSGSVSRPVNIYLYDTLLLISDQDSGITIYSVKDPAGPVFRMNIPVRGNSGVAVKDSIIYANSYGSILVLKVKKDSLYEVVKFIRKEYEYGECCMMVDDYPRRSGWGCSCTGYKATPMGAGSAAPSYSSADSWSGTGTGGSYAVFAVIDSYLYYIDESSIITMDISVPEDPVELSKIYIDWSIETLFPTKDYLFIGGTQGMYVLDRSNPAEPREIGSLSHFRACDPVVVQDTLAYVTLRGGNRCGETRDALLAISIKNPANPVILSEESPLTPYGLCVRDTLLYVSNGHKGMTLYNVSNPRDIMLLKYWEYYETQDFIWAGNVLYVMGFYNILLLDVTDPESPSLYSVIE